MTDEDETDWVIVMGEKIQKVLAKELGIYVTMEFEDDDDKHA